MLENSVELMKINKRIEYKRIICLLVRSFCVWVCWCCFLCMFHELFAFKKKKIPRNGDHWRAIEVRWVPKEGALAAGGAWQVQIPREYFIFQCRPKGGRKGGGAGWNHIRGQEILIKNQDYKYMFLFVCMRVTKKATATRRWFFNLIFRIYFGVGNIYRINVCFFPPLSFSPHSLPLSAGTVPSITITTRTEAP